MARQSKAHNRVIDFPRRHHRNKGEEEKNKLNSEQGETTPTLLHEAKANGRRKRDMAPARPRETRVPLRDDIILRNILLRLPAQSIIRFRSACKLLYTVTNDPSFNHSYATRAVPSRLFRTARTFPNRKGLETERCSDLHLVKSKHNGGDDGLRIEVMNWMRINHCRKKKGTRLSPVASCDGMLCFLVRHEWRYYVCNPLIGDWIPLPDSTHRLYRCGEMIGFYFHVPAGEYRLLSRLFGPKKKGRLYRYEVLTLGTSEWRRINDSPLDTRLDTRSRYNIEAISMHDRLYWTSKKCIGNHVCVHSITLFDTQAEEFREISVPCGDIHEIHHLVRLGEGQLGLCQVTKSMEIHVYILEDYTREVWVKQYTISFQGVPVPVAPASDISNKLIYLSPQTKCGFGEHGIPYIRPMMTAHDDQEIVFAWHETHGPDFLAVFSFNIKLNKLRNVGVEGSLPSEHLDWSFRGQYIETAVSCHYLDKRRRCLHCGRQEKAVLGLRKYLASTSSASSSSVALARPPCHPRSLSCSSSREMARQSKAHASVIEFPRRYRRNKREEENKLNSKQGETPTLRREAKASGKGKRDMEGAPQTSKRPRGTRVPLPDDIMRNILFRLPAQSIIRFRSACNFSVTNDPSFNHSYATRAAPARLFHTAGARKGGSIERYSDLHLVKSKHNSEDDGLKIEVMK